jgi:DNA-binding NtrC family response regulator
VLRESYGEAIELLDEILPEFIAKSSQRDEALCYEFLGDAYRALGDYETAQQNYDRGLEKGRMVSVTSDVVLECLRKTAELKLDQNEIAQSLGTLRQAIKLARKTGDRFELTCLVRLHGRLKHARGQRAAGARLLENAWHDFRAMGAAVEANRTAEFMSSQLRLEGKAEEARVWTRLSGARVAPEGADMRGIPRGRRLTKDLRSMVTKARESGIVSSDPRILKSFQLAVRAAKSDLPALILGETGSGKELFASTIHAHSGNSGSFIPVNCAALPADILDAELFGHSRGAFTGAFRDRAGLIESAAGGTLFLDEIGEMALPVQGRLLRAIELGEIRRLGESKPRRVSTRYVAATHRDLEEMVRKGTFRADLFFRLKGVIIPVPPLRERTWDVDLLIDHFIASMTRKYRRTINLTDEAREQLRNHPWPGNVRELKSVVERLVSLNDHNALIDTHDLGIGEIRYSISLEEHLEHEEKRRLTAILESVQWNKSAAARILKMKRTTLIGKLKRLGIQTPPRR